MLPSEARLGRLRFSGLLACERGRFFCADGSESDDLVAFGEAPMGLDGRIGVLELEASPEGPTLPTTSV